MAHTIVTIAGSLRKQSFTLKIANLLAKLAPASLTLDVITPHGISFFNQDLEANRRPIGLHSAKNCRNRTASCS